MKIMQFISGSDPLDPHFHFKRKAAQTPDTYLVHCPARCTDQTLEGGAWYEVLVQCPVSLDYHLLGRAWTREQRLALTAVTAS